MIGDLCKGIRALLILSVDVALLVGVVSGLIMLIAMVIGEYQHGRHMTAFVIAWIDLGVFYLGYRLLIDG